MANEPLLPCPHCGDAARVMPPGDEDITPSATGWIAVCLGECNARTDSYQSAAYAIAAWNRRADAGWIACAERVPPINQRVLASRRHERIEIMRWGPPPDGYGYDLNNPDQPNVWWCGGEKSGVTHWRPLPAPPADIATRQEAT